MSIKIIAEIRGYQPLYGNMKIIERHCMCNGCGTPFETDNLTSTGTIKCPGCGVYDLVCLMMSYDRAPKVYPDRRIKP